jgi:hypothetical protein
MKFTIRDLLWLTLVAAVGSGWLARERQWQQWQVDPNNAHNWRMVAGTLEWLCASAGYEIRAYDFENSCVHQSTRGKVIGNMTGWGEIGFCKPDARVLGPDDPRPTSDVDFGQQLGP